MTEAWHASAEHRHPCAPVFKYEHFLPCAVPPPTQIEEGKRALQRLVERGAFRGGQVPWEEVSVAGLCWAWPPRAGCTARGGLGGPAAASPAVWLQQRSTAGYIGPPHSEI